jgi:dTDP-4-amino-4,6-dideoxygalactose transaminase
MSFDPGVWPFYSEECRRDVDELLKAGGSLSAYRANKNYGLGPKEGSWAYRLEREIESKFHVKHAVAVNSGTAALHAAIVSTLSEHRSSAGEIVTSPFTFSATAAAILLSGCTPVFADVDPYSFSITKETVSRVLSKRTKAILPVHLFGRVGDVDALRSFGLPVIEDSCQSVGAVVQGTHYAGSLASAAAFSFNGTKNVPAGECGAMVTGSQRRSDQARLLANHAENFGTKWVGYNYRPNELTCCVAWHGLQQLHTRNFERMALAKRLASQMHKIPYLMPPESDSYDGRHVFYVFPFLVYKNRARFVSRMKERGVSVGAGYITPPLHKYPAFRKYARGPLPVVDELSSKTLCLLDCVRPPATLADMDYVAQCIEESL